MARGWRRPVHAASVHPATGPVLLVLLPILVKLPLLAGLARADPMLLFSGIALDVKPGFLGGLPPLPTIDPNIGYTSQALGHRAALDILSGQMPWWNPFEGIGVPLAGEMQSAALFPLTLLLAFRDGQLYEHIALQIIAGLAAWFLLRQLGLTRLAAFAGAAVFAFNGVFAWLGNAVVNPVPFLPLLLLGIERAAAHAQQRRTGGGSWIAIALASSLYAGFPESAYLNGLLAAVWTLTRTGLLPRPDRVRFLIKLCVAGLAGLLIAAPLLIAFADYLAVGDVGPHTGTGFLRRHLAVGDLAEVALPYLYGGIFFDPGHADFWGDVGGYAGCLLPILAFAGAFGRRLRAIRLVLASWTAVAFGLTFGAPWLRWVPDVVPGLSQIALYRYLPASWIMCLCILAAFALDDLTSCGRRRAIGVGLLMLSVMLGFALLVPGATTPPFWGNPASRWTTVAAAGALLSLAASLALRRPTAGIAVLLVGEALAWFVLPTLYAPRRGTLDLAGIAFLREHLGLQRFATLGPIAPNYGAWFGIAAINHNDLPLPRAWTTFVHDRLDRNQPTTVFNGVNREDPSGPSAIAEFVANRANYAAAGVRYLVTDPGLELPFAAEVFRGGAVRIYELDAPSPYFSTDTCRLEVRDRLHLTASCDRPSMLIRLELAMPGWHARVAGRSADIRTIDEMFQAVALPAGTSVVTFDFAPPFIGFGYAAFAGGLLILATGCTGRHGAATAGDGRRRATV